MSNSLQRNRQFLRQINYYLDHRLTKKYVELDNLPVCPYVQRYRNEIRVKIAETSLYEIMEWAVRNWNENETAWVYGFYLDQAPNALICERILDGFAPILYKKGATVFLDHPGNSEPVAGLWTGFGKGVLVTIQKTELLNTARRALLKTKYYQNWSDDDLRNLAE